jgi:tetratricopeptide (TPR) repeat protein
VSATDAEPSDIREKVLRTAENANLLIAICSRKERVFRSEAARTSRINRQEIVLVERECVWQTSEWITQEIGMAIGRGWRIILLLEGGVRKPGGMQGDLEYIPFDRLFPERAFQNLMEMISSLTSEGSPQLGEQTGIGDVEVPNPRAITSSSIDPRIPLIPDAAMTLEQLEQGFLNACFERDEKLMHQYDDAFRTSSRGASDVSRARWTARCEWLQQVFSGKSDLPKVRGLVEEFSADSDVVYYFALLLSTLGEEKAAALEHARAAALTSDSATRVERLTDAARCFARIGDFASSVDVLRKARECLKDSSTTEAELNVIGVLSDVFERKEKLLVAALSERHLQLKPDDQDARFKLGYLYGDNGQSSLALHQYLRIPHSTRSAWTWNNLGVAYGTLGLKGRSTKAYEKAESLGNTLATSNRARLMRDAGFFHIAESDCKTALLKPDADFAALGETLSSISSIRANEEKKEADVVSKAQLAEEYFRDLGSSLINVDCKTWAGEWKGPKYSILIEMSGEQLFGLAEFERASYGIIRPPSLTELGSAPSKPELIKIHLNASTCGRAAYGKIETGASLGILGINSNKVFLILEEGKRLIRVLEVEGDGDFNRYDLTSPE